MSVFLFSGLRFFSIKIKNSFMGSFSKSALSHYYNLTSLPGLRAADGAKHPARDPPPNRPRRKG